MKEYRKPNPVAQEQQPIDEKNNMAEKGSAGIQDSPELPHRVKFLQREKQERIDQIERKYQSQIHQILSHEEKLKKTPGGMDPERLLQRIDELETMLAYTVKSNPYMWLTDATLEKYIEAHQAQLFLTSDDCVPFPYIEVQGKPYYHIADVNEYIVDFLEYGLRYSFNHILEFEIKKFYRYDNWHGDQYLGKD